MIQLLGIYTEDNHQFKSDLKYVCRVFAYVNHGNVIEWRNGLDLIIELKDGDVIRMFGNGTWFALYQ